MSAHSTLERAQNYSRESASIEIRFGVHMVYAHGPCLPESLHNDAQM